MKRNTGVHDMSLNVYTTATRKRHVLFTRALCRTPRRKRDYIRTVSAQCPGGARSLRPSLPVGPGTRTRVAVHELPRAALLSSGSKLARKQLPTVGHRVGRKRRARLFLGVKYVMNGIGPYCKQKMSAGRTGNVFETSGGLGLVSVGPYYCNAYTENALA